MTEKDYPISRITADDIEAAYKGIKRDSLIIRGSLMLIMVFTVVATVAAFGLMKRAGLGVNVLAYLKSETGRYAVIVPTKNPAVTDRQASHWAALRVVDLLSINFKSAEYDVMRRRAYFQPEAWDLYIGSIIENDIINKVLTDGLIINTVVLNKPQIVKKYRESGNISWYIQMNVMQSIQGATDKTQNNRLKVIIDVEEVSRDKALEGLLIKQFMVL